MKILRDTCADEHSMGNCSLGALGIYSSASGKGALEGEHLKVIEFWTEQEEMKPESLCCDSHFESDIA